MQIIVESTKWINDMPAEKGLVIRKFVRCLWTNTGGHEQKNVKTDYF